MIQRTVREDPKLNRLLAWGHAKARRPSWTGFRADRDRGSVWRRVVDSVRITGKGRTIVLEQRHKAESDLPWPLPRLARAEFSPPFKTFSDEIGTMSPKGHHLPSDWLDA